MVCALRVSDWLGEKWVKRDREGMRGMPELWSEEGVGREKGGERREDFTFFSSRISTQL